MRYEPKKFLYGGLVALVAGCGPAAAVVTGAGEGASASSSSSTEGGAPTSGGTAIVSGGVGTSHATGTSGGVVGSGVSTSEGSSLGADDWITFILPPDLSADQCDLFTQRCPAGEKCMPYADDGGGSWNNTKCVPIMEDPVQVDEPCFAEGYGVSGIDNCDLGLMCWDVDAEGQGYCIAMCVGTIEAPTCEDPTKVCAVNRLFALCISYCDPLEQDCGPDDVCIGNPNGVGFLCVLDASGDEGQVHDPCMYANSCDPGLICLDSTAAVECDPQVQGCCQPFCDLDKPTMCAGQGQVCNHYYEEGGAPPGYENVGYCAVPM